MKLYDLYFRMYDSQTILLYEKDDIFIGRFTIGTFPNELENRLVFWIAPDNFGNLKIYIEKGGA